MSFSRDEEILDRFLAGDTVAGLAVDYCLSSNRIGTIIKAMARIRNRELHAAELSRGYTPSLSFIMRNASSFSKEAKQQIDDEKGKTELIKSLAPEMLDILKELAKYAPGRYSDDPRSDDEIDAAKEAAFAKAVELLEKANQG